MFFIYPWTVALRQPFKIIGMSVTMCQGFPQISAQESKAKSPLRPGDSLMKATIVKRWLVLNKVIIIITVAPGHIYQVLSMHQGPEKSI